MRLSEVEFHQALTTLGLKHERPGESFRCGHCDRMQAESALMVYVPEYMKVEGLTHEILAHEIARDGDQIGWCEECVRTLPLTPGFVVKKGLISRLIEAVAG